MPQQLKDSVDGVMVSIGAFQALDPSSILGQRSNFLLSCYYSKSYDTFDIA